MEWTGILVMKKKKRNNFGYYLKEGVGSIFAHGFMSFASVCIILACLIIMGVFSLLVANINALIAEAESKNEITAYIEEEMSEEDARQLEGLILRINNVSSAEFITREIAKERFASGFDDTYFDEIEATVFRNRFVVYMEDIAQMSQTKDDLMSIDGIAKVNAHTEVAQAFVRVRNVVSAVSIALVAILFVISVFIISNTTKLATFDRREEIAIMKMVGATNSFIRWPFIFQGFILGMFAALLSFVILWAGYELLGGWIMDSVAGGLISVISFSYFARNILIAFLAIGFVVGSLGSVVTIRNYLKV